MVSKKLIFICLGVLAWYSIFMAITAMGFILDGYMTWYEHSLSVAIAEFSLSVFFFFLAIYVLKKLAEHDRMK